ncbi:hypothetical protein HDU91_005509 [Kappamyces sp. JEL0680]|nr:hypothetical protein HDU91_005509 [Kappamyces sp. JEL0680]
MAVLDRTSDKDEYTPVMDHTVLNQILLPLQAFFSELEDAALLSPLMAVLKQAAKWYPLPFSSLFPSFMDLLVGWHLDVQTDDTTRHDIGRLVHGFYSFWPGHSGYGLRLGLNLVFDLQELYGLELEPAGSDGSSGAPTLTTNPAKALCLADTLDLVLRSLVWAFFPMVNKDAASISELEDGKDIGRQLVHLGTWSLRVLACLCSHTTSGSVVWRDKLHWSICWCMVIATVDHGAALYQECLGVLDGHIRLVEKEFKETRDTKRVHGWIESLMKTFPAFPSLVFSYTFYQTFLPLDPANPGFLQTHYRAHVADHHGMTETLDEACLRFALAYPSKQILGSEPLFYEQLCQEFDWVLHLVDAEHVPKPRPSAFVLGESLSKHRRVLESTLKIVVGIGTDSTCSTSQAAWICREVFQFLSRSLEAGPLVAAAWWDLLHGQLVSSIFSLCQSHAFFLPRLAVGPESQFETHDLCAGQFGLIRECASMPHLYGLSLMGLVWVKEIVTFCLDKNYLDTDVTESWLLEELEVVLTEFLSSSRVQQDPHIRQLIGQVWIDYLQGFSSNRRGRENSANILSLVLSR